MTVCLSGRMSRMIFMIWGSKPMSSIRSASSSTSEQQKRKIQFNCWLSASTLTPTLPPITTTDQVSDGAKMNKLVHLEVIESSGCGNHYVHAALHQVDLAPPVAPAVDADTGRRWDSSSMASYSLNNDNMDLQWRGTVKTWCSPCSGTFCTLLRSARPALVLDSEPACLDLHVGVLVCKYKLMW